jgi:hypothetical protein
MYAKRVCAVLVHGVLKCGGCPTSGVVSYMVRRRRYQLPELVVRRELDGCSAVFV